MEKQVFDQKYYDLKKIFDKLHEIFPDGKYEIEASFTPDNKAVLSNGELTHAVVEGRELCSYS